MRLCASIAGVSTAAQIDRTEAFLEEFFAALHDDPKGEAHV
jgi:hypothetical protein